MSAKLRLTFTRKQKQLKLIWNWQIYYHSNRKNVLFLLATPSWVPTASFRRCGSFQKIGRTLAETRGSLAADSCHFAVHIKLGI